MKQKKFWFLLIGLAAAAVVGWTAKSAAVVETEQLRIVDKQGRLRYTIDSCITSYDSTGRVKGIFH